ncbi:MAG: hypothetical protein V7676_17125 [Parasphingorhabdus sp.]|uniref:hypothetical protein n=1 Tax=Parasphingorhabdus sp. TaxID=2709688 RepID=UPI00300135EF
MTANDFRDELKQLRAYRGSFHGDDLFDWFESTGLITPILRLAWPEEIARRWWREGHEWAGEMRDPMAPDGDLLDAAESLDRALSRSGMRGARDNAPHPFDDPDPRWVPFLQTQESQSFTPRSERRFSVGNARDEVCYDRNHVRDFYTAWQVLAAAEIADMGIFFRVNMTDDEIAEAAHEAIRNGNRPDGPAFELFAPSRALRALSEHRAPLDAAIWASEEGEIAFLRAARGHGGGRIQLSEPETAEYHAGRIAAARAAMARYECSVEDVLVLCGFLGRQWGEWDREGRPLIAEAYKIHLAAAVRMIQLAEDMMFEDIAERVGPAGSRVGPLLRQVWPDWAAEQRQKIVMTLRPSLPHSGPGAVSDSELEAFAQFLEDERQDGFFLRLSSFESHAFDGDDPSPLSGMTSDLQSIAVATEHAVRAMGGMGNQLYMMFKQLWAGTSVEPLLKSNSPLARNAALMKDWPALKAQIAALSDTGESGAVAARFIMAHRIRGAVHVPVPEDDQLELERLFVQIMASAAMTHAHLARETAPTR